MLLACLTLWAIGMGIVYHINRLLWAKALRTTTWLSASLHSRTYWAISLSRATPGGFQSVRYRPSWLAVIAKRFWATSWLDKLMRAACELTNKRLSDWERRSSNFSLIQGSRPSANIILDTGKNPSFWVSRREYKETSEDFLQLLHELNSNRLAVPGSPTLTKSGSQTSI